MFKLKLPALDENVLEYKVGHWLKSVGESVAVGEPVLEVETDKVTMEVSAEVAGTLSELVAAEGDVLAPGAMLAMIETESAELPIANGQSSIVSEKPRRETRLTPVVARMVSEHQLDVTKIEGTGRNGRITKKDVQAYLKDEGGRQKAKISNLQSPIPNPQPLVSSPNPPAPNPQSLPLNAMRRSIAEHMVRSLQTSPHVTTLFEFDFHRVAAHRAEHKATFAQDGVKLTYMAYIALATVQALKAFPLVNSVFQQDRIELKSDIHLGMITAVSDGLFAPVIHHADGYNLRGMARQIATVAEKARAGILKPSDTQGGTFSISNHGSAGSLAGTPIIFQPQAGILGVGKIEERVKVIDGGLHIRPCAYISFSFDHRIMDGAVADGFVSHIKETIENWA